MIVMDNLKFDITHDIETYCSKVCNEKMGNYCETLHHEKFLFWRAGRKGWKSDTKKGRLENFIAIYKNVERK